MRIELDRFPGGRRRVLVLSYDDGTTHDRRLVEIFNAAGVRGTFHLNSGWLDTPKYITSAEVASRFAGHEVSCHSVSHPDLTKLPPDLAAEQMMSDRRALEALVGYPVRGMSYPSGTYNDQVLAVLRTVGIEYSRTTQATGRMDLLPADPLLWHPTTHHARNLPELTRQFLDTSRDGMRVLYVWGHSYEFDRNDNWQTIEDFCRAAGGRDDTWYATNAELAAYVRAARALRFSVGGGIVQNPSAVGVWFTADGKAVEVPPGQTVTVAARA